MGSHSYHDYPKNNPLNFLLAGFLFVVFILCLMFSSCSVQKRIGGLAIKHPDEFKRACVLVAPPEIKTVTNTEYLPGIPVVTIDTVYGDCDPVIKYVDGKKVVTIQRVKMPCPPSSVRVDTIVKTSTITIENTAKIDVLSKDLTTCQAETDRLKKGRSTWRFIALGALVLLLGGAALKIFTKRLG